MEKEEPIDLEYPLLNDYVFKFVFSHEKLHQELLELFEEFINESIIFNIDHIHAQELLMAPHYNLKDYYGDVLSVTKDDTIVSLEVYNRFSENEYKKSLCYIARIYGNQLKTKEPYSNAKKVVGISLFNRKIRFNMDNVAEEYKLTEQITRIKTNDEMILFLIDIDKLAKFTYNKCERLRNLAIILKMRWLKDMEKYIENKEDEMLEQTVAYVKEFLSNPANHNLIDHHASEVANAKIEGIDETKLAIIKRMQAKNYSKKEIMSITGINNSEYDKLLQMS